MKTVLLLFLTLCVSAANSQLQTVNIYFDKLSSEIRPEGKLKLEKLAVLIKAESTVIQSISAYSDTLGTIELNARLAKERFSNSLKVLGIKNNDNSFETNFYGEEFPFNASEYNTELYRRVTIVHFVKEEVIEEIIEEVIVEEVVEGIVEELVGAAPSKLIVQLEKFINDKEAEEVLLELSILFIGDKDIVMTESKVELEQLYSFLKKHGQLTAQIRGHVCCKPNSKLSKARAKTVHDFLISKSISSRRLTYKGFSNKLLKVEPERTDADRQSNRRVDIIFKK
ncbi:MAG: OmpA family protein [Crocinitomicaceae bacterium]